MLENVDAFKNLCDGELQIFLGMKLGRKVARVIMSSSLFMGKSVFI